MVLSRRTMQRRWVMRASDAVGRRVTKVCQERIYSTRHARSFVVLRYIQLENGTRLYPGTLELEADYGTTMTAVKAVKRVTRVPWAERR